MSKQFTCQKCLKIFKQKSGYDAHMQRKTDCSKPATFEKVLELKIKEVVKSTQQKPDITIETLPLFFEDLHNLLWNKAGLNPERALEHMTFFFAYRLIEQQADILNLPQECRWSYVASIKNENDLFETIKKGVSEFRKKPKTKPFFKPHEIQKAEIVYEIVQQIDRISLTILRETDTLGDIFEYMLGRGMSTMSDDGQYFTNRLICKLAFKLAYSIKKTLRRADGSLCTFADWFCGTGGFPAEYIKGVNKNLPDINWKKESGSIYCQDMNLSSVTTTLLNMLILTGIPFSGEKIRGSNSFSEPIITGINAPFSDLNIDYCLMNPPYGGDKSKGKEYKFAYVKKVKSDDGKSIKKYFVNQEIQSIGIEDDDKVSAGVQLAMATLSENGVCSIVLPQGFFFGVSKKCIELRKKITEEYCIHYVVDIASGSFINTYTKTSIIVFQKGVGPTKKVSFININEEVLVCATLTEIRCKNYSLNYKQYLPQNIVEIKGFKTVKLGDIVDKKTSGKTKRGDISNSGEFPFFSCGITNPCGTHLTYDHEEPEYLLFTKSGGNSKRPTGNSLGIGRFYYMTEKSASTSDVSKFTIKKDLNISLKYVSIVLSTKLYDIQSLARYTTGLGHIDIDEMLNVIQIPLPSLEKQQEIVEQIDFFTQLTHTEEQSLKILEKVVMFWVKEIGKGHPKIKLENLLKNVKGKRHAVSEGKETGLYPLLRSSKDGKVKWLDNYVYEGPYITVGNGGEANFRLIEKFNASTHTIVYDVNNSLMEFVYYSIQNIRDKIGELCFQGTGLENLNMILFMNMEISIPPLPDQQSLQSDFDEIRHKRNKIEEYKVKAQNAIIRLIPNDTNLD